MPRVYQTTLDWPRIEKLYSAGYGTKAIAKQIGCSQIGVREGLIKRGLYQFGQNRPGGSIGHWAGRVDELIAEIAAWRAADRWWTQGNKVTQMERYYRNHIESKRRQAATAKARYHRIKHMPEYKAKQFARAQLSRIARQVRQDLKSKRTHEYLGCTYAQASAHLSSLLPAHWTWENYGKDWEIDHRLQLSDGLLTDELHLARVCHYTNLRPMAVSVNRARQRGAMARRQISA